MAAAAATGCLDVAAVASRDAARADSYAREQGIARSHGSYDALLSDPDVEAVYIALPNRLHHEWTMRALAAGKHVLCEKPYSRRPTDVEQAFDAADERDLVLMEGFMYRHHPQTRYVADLVADGAVGRLRAVRASFNLFIDRPDDPRFRPDLDRGSLMDVGCYCISGSRLLAGEPKRVLGEQVVGATGVDVSFRGTLEFPDDVKAEIDCSFVLPLQQRLEAVGEEGSISMQAPFRPDWGGEILLQRGGKTTHIEVPDANSYERELENFADAVAGAAPPLLGREDALGQARTIDALFRSAASPRAVDL